MSWLIKMNQIIIIIIYVLGHKSMWWNKINDFFFTRYIQGNKAIILLKLYKLKNNLKLYYNLCIEKSWISIDIYNLSYESIKTVYYFT